MLYIKQINKYYQYIDSKQILQCICICMCYIINQ